MRYQELMESDAIPRKVADALSDAMQSLKNAQGRNSYGATYRGPAKQEGGGDWFYIEARYWGDWHNPSDAEDEEDYDWQVLSEESAKKLHSIVDGLRKQYPELKIDCSTEEKNWIMIEARLIPQTELDAEAKRIAALPKRNLHDMLSKKLNGKKIGPITFTVSAPQNDTFTVSWQIKYKGMLRRQAFITYEKQLTKAIELEKMLADKYKDYIYTYYPFNKQKELELDRYTYPQEIKNEHTMGNRIQFYVYKPKKKK